jgi:hypothetical protein
MAVQVTTAMTYVTRLHHIFFSISRIARLMCLPTTSLKFAHSA